MLAFENNEISKKVRYLFFLIDIGVLFGNTDFLSTFMRYQRKKRFSNIFK